MADKDRLLEYVAVLQSRVNDRALDNSEDGDDDENAFHENAFTEVVVGLLEELGQVSDVEVRYFESKFGRGSGKVNGWLIDEDAAQVDLITTVYRGEDQPGSITNTELNQVIKRAARVYFEATQGFHEKMEPASPSYDMMEAIYNAQRDIERLRIIVIADGITGDTGRLDRDLQNANLELQVDVWDLQRLYRADSSGLPYEPTDIDLAARLGTALPCLPMPETAADYTAYLAILPGKLVHSLYHEYGARLLELNVRSFLQARGKVNKGIRDTLRSEPLRFLAYNNGISATAERVELEVKDGVTGIRAITGLQIVNGGQTVASIHRAGQHEKVDLSGVFVQAKITIVRPEHIETLVPLISRFANTQNRVNEADFSANHPFHVKLQQLSDTIWTPGEQSRWFYERARGQYEVAKAREATTTAKRKRFEAAVPTRQRFDKVALAKYENTWSLLPHIVSRGGQKNFTFFMDRLAKLHSHDWEPDPRFYRELIAKAILFKRAEKIGRSLKLKGYTANVVTYTTALLAYRTAGRIDLSSIWNEQDISKAVEATLIDWMPTVYDELVESSDGRNVTEWCKKEQCWRHIQTLDVAISRKLEKELAEGQAVPTVGDPDGKQGNLSSEDRENIARVMQVSAEDWIRMVTWGSGEGELEPWQLGIATTLAGYAAAGWGTIPSKKQALRGVEIIRLFAQNGTDEDDVS
jgi:hypothetical protein